jgi:hypothetical protein
VTVEPPAADARPNLSRSRIEIERSGLEDEEIDPKEELNSPLSRLDFDTSAKLQMVRP